MSFPGEGQGSRCAVVHGVAKTDTAERVNNTAVFGSDFMLDGGKATTRSIYFHSYHLGALVSILDREIAWQ